MYRCRVGADVIRMCCQRPAGPRPGRAQSREQENADQREYTLALFLKVLPGDMSQHNRLQQV